MTDGKFEGSDEGIADGYPGIHGTDEMIGSLVYLFVEKN